MQAARRKIEEIGYFRNGQLGVDFLLDIAAYFGKKRRVAFLFVSVSDAEKQKTASEFWNSKMSRRTMTGRKGREQSHVVI